ncbi:MAG: class II fructose-bisphosphate aldolase [Kiritimatiellaeota bacterium]|nr:class II fructose-bisphosphate aldolase [Kiritimatiellota bacterium]
MPLVNPMPMLEKARAEGFCVGAFNVVDYLSIEAVVEAAERKRAPVIIQTSSATIKRFGIENIVTMTRMAAAESTVPICLHLDHGTDVSVIKEAIEKGYSSVMIDASKLAFEENIAVSKEVVEAAHKAGLAVEGEIGLVAGVEDDIVVNAEDAIYTTPEEAIEFQARSGVDFLAAAIGTAHGFYKVAPKLNIDTLREIRVKTDFPLVVHGGTGLPTNIVMELVEAGGAKFNVSTQIKQTYIDSMYGYIQEKRDEYNILKVLDAAKQGLADMIAEYMTILGGEGKA